MSVLLDYSEEDRKFYEAIGLLIAREVTAEKAAQLAGYSFTTFLEILKKKKIYPFTYEENNYEMDLRAIENM